MKIGETYLIRKSMGYASGFATVRIAAELKGGPTGKPTFVGVEIATARDLTVSPDDVIHHFKKGEIESEGVTV